MTNLLERYLQAIGQFLPTATKEDMLAELQANLLEQMDAREEELGHPLTDGDVAAILKQHGKPELVALRYLPQRSLIGPTIYPFYEFTLVRVMPLVIFVYALTRGIAFVEKPHGSVAHQLTAFAFGLIPVLLTFWVSVTIVFAVIERVREDGKLDANWNEWDPTKLPAVKAHAASGGPRLMAKKVIDLAAHCLWMAYVLWIPWHPFWILGPGVFYLNRLDVTLAPVWHVFYGLLIVLLTVQLAAKLLAFVPAAESWQKPLKLVAGVFGVVATGYLAFATVYFSPGSAMADVANIAMANHSVGLALRIVFVLSVIGLVKEGWRYARSVTPRARFAF